MNRILFAGLVLVPALGHAGDVSVMPSLIEARVDPGGDYTTVVQIGHSQLNDGDVGPVRIVLSTENWDMDRDGHLTFVRTDGADSSSALPWVVFSPGEFELTPGSIEHVRLSIIVPEDVSPGEYRAALIIQPRDPYEPLAEREKRLSFRFRLATILYLEVPPVTRDAVLANLTVEETPAGGWRIEPTLVNVGNAHVRVFDSYQIVPVEDPEGRVVAAGYEETLPGLTPVDTREAGVLLPGRRRALSVELPAGLKPGHYKLLYQADVGDDVPLLMGEMVFTIPDAATPTTIVAERDAADTD